MHVVFLLPWLIVVYPVLLVIAFYLGMVLTVAGCGPVWTVRDTEVPVIFESRWEWPTRYYWECSTRDGIEYCSSSADRETK